MSTPNPLPPIASARELSFLTLALLVSVLHTASCGDDTGAASQGTIESWSLSAEPTIIIGGADDREGYLLHQVVGATRLADGRIVVANRSTLELRYYDSEGSHIFDAGGHGEGPGEFLSLGAFARLPGDSIVVLSWRSGLTRFGPDGRYAGTVSYDLPPHGDCETVEGEQLPLPDGSILMGLSVFVGLNDDHEECPHPGEARPSVTVGRLQPATGLFDTLAVLPAVEKVYGIESQYAYAKNLVHGIARDRVYLGDTGSDTILEISFKGDTIAILPVPFEPVVVPVDAREKQFEDREWTGGGQTITQRTTFIYADHYPRYARLVPAPEDRVWVMAYPPLKDPIQYWELVIPTASLRLDEGARWSVVGRDGRAVAELHTPPGFFLLEVGDDYILGLPKDEFDRESVQVYRLTR